MHLLFFYRLTGCFVSDLEGCQWSMPIVILAHQKFCPQNLVRDELSGWLATLNKAGREGEREFWLECWGGKGSYTVDRIGRGTVHASSLCLSIFGAIQPDKLESLITNSLQSNDDGLLQRFQLLVCPQIKEKWENHDISPDYVAQKNVEALFEKIAEFSVCESEKFLGLHFSSDAQDLFNSWREGLENSLRSQQINSSPYEAHLSKYRSLIPALALIFEVIDSEVSPSEVRYSSLALAIEWSSYLIEHAKKIYQIENYHQYQASIQALIKKIKEKKIQDGDSVRTIARHGWESLKNTEQIETALEFMAQKHWIQVIEKYSHGRPSRIVRIHPSLLS